MLTHFVIIQSQLLILNIVDPSIVCLKIRVCMLSKTLALKGAGVIQEDLALFFSRKKEKECLFVYSLQVHIKCTKNMYK